MSLPRFVLITPAHNESAQAEELVAAVRNSKLQPDTWVVVDDNSTDGTGAAFSRAAEGLDCFRLHRIESAGEYMAFRYSEVVQAGLSQLEWDDHTYVGVLDADIRFGPSYWHELYSRMQAEPRLGIASGVLCARDANDELELEVGQHLDLPRGGLRLVRGECLREVGGVCRARSPDTIMTVRARLAGWRTALFDDLVVLSTRPTGTRAEYANAAKSYGQRYWDLGRPAWFPVYKALRCLQRRDPEQATGLLQGYFGEWLKGSPRAADAAVREYYRWEPLRRAWVKVRAKLNGTSAANSAVKRRVVHREELLK